MIEFTYLGPEALGPPIAEHDHVWLLACRKDQRGLRVLDCACGARRYQRALATGDFVDVDVPNGPLFDVTDMQIPGPLRMGG